MFWERKNERLELVKNLGSENKQNVTTIRLVFYPGGLQGYKCYILNFKHLSKVVLQKILKVFFIYFYGLNIGPPGAGPSCIQGPSFEQTL